MPQQRIPAQLTVECYSCKQKIVINTGQVDEEKCPKCGGPSSWPMTQDEIEQAHRAANRLWRADHAQAT